MDCEWYIHAPTGHYMTFNFLSFNLQYGSNCTVVDYVEIREHNSTGLLDYKGEKEKTSNVVVVYQKYTKTCQNTKS